VSGAIDHVVAQYHYPGGPIVSAEGSWAMQPGFGFSATFTVNFERATVDFDGARGPEALRLYVAGQAPQTIRPEGGDGYVQELLYWTDCVREGRAPRTVTAEDASAVLVLCEATERSIAQGTTVAVP
jgi:predicted dehydrogenase